MLNPPSLALTGGEEQWPSWDTSGSDLHALLFLAAGSAHGRVASSWSWRWDAGSCCWSRRTTPHPPPCRTPCRRQPPTTLVVGTASGRGGSRGRSGRTRAAPPAPPDPRPVRPPCRQRPAPQLADAPGRLASEACSICTLLSEASFSCLLACQSAAMAAMAFFYYDASRPREI